MCDTTFVILVIIVSGVVSVISPWNVPLHLSTRAVAPALVLSIDPFLDWSGKGDREIYENRLRGIRLQNKFRHKSAKA
jgi:hypothetical protein